LPARSQIASTARAHDHVRDFQPYRRGRMKVSVANYWLVGDLFKAAPELTTELSA
jgi:hypothetical protein